MPAQKNPLSEAKRLIVLLFMATFLGTLYGCNEEHSSQQQIREPVEIADSDECHVCGMLIVNYPGPKGEALERGRSTPRKFCSTRDMFAYLLQPESTALVREVYVHDMAVTDWRNPRNVALVDGREAWYVAGHPLRGAMGPTLAAFRQRYAAEAFINLYGGTLLRYEDITLEVISNLDYGHQAETEKSNSY